MSVVMPVRDGERYLRRALASVREQTLGDLELIVVDDGSRDSTPAILEEVAAEDRRVHVLTRRPEGLARALNAGCAIARAPYIARLDADDVALPERLERQSAHLDAHPRLVVLGTSYVVIDADGRRRDVVARPGDDATLQRLLLRFNCFGHATVMLRRDAFERVGEYRLANAEDYDLWLRLAERGELGWLPEVLTEYRHHEGQFSVGAVEGQALGVLAAREAALARRAGRPDPLDGVHELDDAALWAAGVSVARRRRAVARDVARWAASLEATGNRDDAARLIARAGATRWPPGRAELRARLALARLRARLGARRRRAVGDNGAR